MMEEEGDGVGDDGVFGWRWRYAKIVKVGPLGRYLRSDVLLRFGGRRPCSLGLIIRFIFFSDLATVYSTSRHRFECSIFLIDDMDKRPRRAACAASPTKAQQ